MSKREAGLKTLEALRNTDDTQFIASDDDDAKEVDDTSQHVIDSIESTINRVNLDQNLDKTKKNWSCLDKAKEWRKFITKKKINFNERSEPTSYATRNKDNTKILAFMMNFDMYMLNLIVQCTNSTRM
ncbi:hypothetical protein BpHYR1_037761 [Brachionus plicatilis]|uniref:Uncharacterized protein n=1 Tax=Brachionus plicatilis TaxID=10195 RepID=A0A3M7RAB8_BRAPC|nr:hypothetical protein BpHYR1_037761 [Brachionus plicatilis]